MSGTKPYRPANEGNKSDRNDGQERHVRANAITTQSTTGPSRSNGQGEKLRVRFFSRPRNRKVVWLTFDGLRRGLA